MKMKSYGNYIYEKHFESWSTGLIRLAKILNDQLYRITRGVPYIISVKSRATASCANPSLAIINILALTHATQSYAAHWLNLG